MPYDCASAACARAEGRTAVPQIVRGARGSRLHALITMLLLPWALLPITAVRASNAWHTDEDCGCHNLNSAWGIRTMFERGYNASLKHRASDLKQLKDKSKQTKSEKKLRQALTYELWRSLRAYRSQQISTREAVRKSNVAARLSPRLNHGLHAIDATPARRRAVVDSSPLDGASTAAPCARETLVVFHTGEKKPSRRS